MNIGQWVLDVIKGQRVQVIEKFELWGFKCYRVYEPISRTTYQVPENCLSTDFNSNYYDSSFVRYITSLAKLKNELSGGIISAANENVIPLPHQIYALNRALENNNVRYLIADEVGLGKTIEAGLILKELKTRGLIKRVLVVCPKGLVTQWHAEMKEKFGEEFKIILPEDYDTIKRLTGKQNVFEEFEQVISPMDAIKPLEKRAGWDSEKIQKYNNNRIHAILSGGWDLIIIDEAHRVAGSSTDVARYKLGNLLSKASPYILLLTATPHSGKAEPFLRLIRLLDEKAFPDYRAIVKEQVAPFIIRTEKSEAIDGEGNKLFKGRITKVIEIKWEERHSIQRELYELVTEYVSSGYNKAIKEKKYYIGFLMVLMQRLVSSSTAAIKESVEKRISILENQESKLSDLSMEDFANVDTERALEDAIAVMAMNLKSEIIELKNILALAKQAEFQFLDAKAENLIDVLDYLYSEDSDRKVIIFTEFVSTQNFLKSLLEKRGYTSSILNGSMNIDERNTILNEFRTKTDLLLSTDAGGEGLNLQFSNVVINYDLTWNPMKIEQRIGRVDRIGQNKDVLVFNYVLSDTVEKRVKEVLEKKLAIIFEQIGIDKLKDVLDNEFAEIDFTDAYIKSISNPKKADYYLGKLEESVKEQVKQAQEVKELIKDVKTLEPADNASIINENMIGIIKNMYFNYNQWKNDNANMLDDFYIDLNNPKIKHIIDQELIWSLEDGAIIINLPDLPNEKGFWSLWELSLGKDAQDKRIIALFINDSGNQRPASAKRIWEEFIKPNRAIEVLGQQELEQRDYERLVNISQDLAYDVFLHLKNKYEERIERDFNRYIYALDLRIDAANNIGIENIKRHRIEQLNMEKDAITKEYYRNKNICPVFKPIFIAYME